MYHFLMLGSDVMTVTDVRIWYHLWHSGSALVAYIHQIANNKLLSFFFALLWLQSQSCEHMEGQVSVLHKKWECPRLPDLIQHLLAIEQVCFKLLLLTWYHQSLLFCLEHSDAQFNVTLTLWRGAIALVVHTCICANVHQQFQHKRILVTLLLITFCTTLVYGQHRSNLEFVVIEPLGHVTIFSIIWW